MKEYLLKIVNNEKKGIVFDVVRLVLSAMSVVYGIFVRGIVFLYDKNILKKRRLPKPVISVGNITVGGVGKTPFVAYLAGLIKRQGYSPVILTRGYMHSGNALSDEAAMLQSQLDGVKVLSGKNRYETAADYLNTGDCDVFILDDGFQHWRLYRDMDIVLIDATNAFGNGYILPRGTLREHKRALNRADGFVLTKTDIAGEKTHAVEQSLKRFDKDFIIRTVHKPVGYVGVGKDFGVCDIESLRNREVCVFSGIGDNKSFEETVLNSGCVVKLKFRYIDHYSYKENDIITIINACKENNIKIIITTLKDSVKVTKFAGLFQNLSLYALKIEIGFVPCKTRVEHEEENLRERIVHLLQR